MLTTHFACGQHCFPQLNLAQFDMRAVSYVGFGNAEPGDHGILQGEW